MAAPRKFDHEEACRLREEGWSIADLAAHYGVTKGSVSQATAAVIPREKPQGVPETFAEMRDMAAPLLWEYFKAATGVAKVQAYRAIVDAAKRESDGVEEVEAEPLLADVVSGAASLSPVRMREILTENRTRFAEELARIDDVLERLDGAVTV